MPFVACKGSKYPWECTISERSASDQVFLMTFEASMTKTQGASASITLMQRLRKNTSILTSPMLRIISDFTKMVRIKPIVEGMLDKISTDINWQLHFKSIMGNSCAEPDLIIPIIQRACEWLVGNLDTIRRQTLQTRFFETGDNFYLGMELLREYNRWKKFLVKQLLSETLFSGKNDIMRVEKQFMDSIDRLWYENCLETIRTGDVYNPGARHRVPRLHLINAQIDTELGKLPVGESFRLVGYSDEVYEILEMIGREVIVRNAEGFVSEMEKCTRVFREGNLTRSPDGNQESKVVSKIALATLCDLILRHYSHRASISVTVVLPCGSLRQSSDNALI